MPDICYVSLSIFFSFQQPLLETYYVLGLCCVLGTYDTVGSDDVLQMQ